MSSTNSNEAQQQQQAIKTRIITHMNADHADSLSLFLQHYNGVPASRSTPAKLSDITTEHMIIESPIGRTLIPLDPPMTSLSESRERMVAMHQTALKGLGLSEIKIDEIAGPAKAWQWVLLGLCLLCYTTLPFPERIRPGSGSWMASAWSVGGLVPSLAELAADLAGKVLPGMLVAHAVETTYLWWSRLNKHRVEVGSTVWWWWMVSTFISGGGAITRFDQLVKSKEQKAKAGKH